MNDFNKLEKYKFPVERIPLVGIKQIKDYPDGAVSTNVIGIFDEHGEILGHHTKEYTITTNKKLLDSGLEIMADMGLNIVKIDENLSWTNDKRMYVSFITDKEFSPNGGDPHSLMLTIYNSYDGSMSWGCELGLWRQVCSNGAFVVRLMKRYKKKHSCRDSSVGRAGD